MRTFKVKLNIQNKAQREALKMMSGAYRAIFNSAIDLQQDVLHANVCKSKKYEVSGKALYYHYRDRSDRLFPYLKGLDKGILSAVCFHASVSFKRWWEQYGPEYKYRQPKHLAKKDNMHFRTDGNVRIFYDYIEVPKLGRIKLFEKGYLPQGKKCTNFTFSYDGNDWYLSLVVLDEESVKKEKLTGAPVVVDFNNEGDLIINNEVIRSVVSSEAYQKEERRYNQLAKKLRRQKRANVIRNSRGVAEVRTSKNMMKTKKLLAKSEVRMNNMRLDQFKKVASEVAITKPKKLLGLSKEVIGKERQGGLSFVMRKKHTLDFLNILQKKLETLGTQIVLHKSLKRFTNMALGFGVTACGELVSSSSSETINSVKQELCVA